MYVLINVNKEGDDDRESEIPLRPVLPSPSIPLRRVPYPCERRNAAMISFQPRNHADDEARRAAVRRVADWVEQALPEEQRDATHVMVNQVECREAGCPPVEGVIALLRKPKIVVRVRPRHACIAMSCCPTLAHAPRAASHAPLTHRTPRLATVGAVLWLCAVLQARGGGDEGRGGGRLERYAARGEPIRSWPPRARARAP